LNVLFVAFFFEFVESFSTITHHLFVAHCFVHKGAFSQLSF